MDNCLSNIGMLFAYKRTDKTNATPKILYTFHWGVEGSVNEKFQTSHQSRR